MYLSEPSSTPSTKGFYFYDFHLPNRDTHLSSNILNSERSSSSIYNNSRAVTNPNNFYHREDYNNRLYDNVPRKNLNSQINHSSSSNNFGELSIRPIAEVKPYYVYSTTDHAVASAEQRLYDAVSTLSRRRAALNASETQFSPMNSYRNNHSSSQQPIINSSATVIRPKPVYGYQNIHRSVSIGPDDSSFHHHNQYSSNQNSNSSNGSTYSSSKRSYYPVYRQGGITMVSPPSTCTLTRRSSGMTDSYNSQRYQNTDTYFSPFLPVTRPKESVYRTSFIDSSSSYEPTQNKKSSSSELGYVRTPMIQQPYAVSNNTACMRNDLAEKANKSTTLEWTNFDENIPRLRDDLITTNNSKVRRDCRDCRSCMSKGVDCESGQNFFDKEVVEKRKSFKNAMNFEKVSTNFQANNHSSCFPILERKQKAPPPYDALYSVSNISSSSSAYSSGSSPLEPSDLTISTSADYPPEMLSLPLNCKVNYAPPRPHSKPQTIAAVSPNHVSTVSIPESTDLPPRATSAIHFENSNNKKDMGRTRRYSTLRPSKPPPPPPHQNSTSPLQNKSLSTISVIPSPKLVTKRSKRDERAAMLRAQSKITLMENFFQTDKSQAPQPSVAPTFISAAGITSRGAVSNVRHLEESGGNIGKIKLKKNKKKDKKPKIRKEDIGNPINFQHKAHIGWNQDGGFNQQVFDAEPMDDSVKALLRAAGHDPDSLRPDEVKFVYSFLESYKPPEAHKPPEKKVPPSPTISNPVPIMPSAKPNPPLPPAFSTRQITHHPSTSEARHNRPLPQLPPSTNVHDTPRIPRHEQVPARPPPPPPPASTNYQSSTPPTLPGSRTASLKPAPSSASAPPPPPPPPPPPLLPAMKSNGAVPPPPPPPPPPGSLAPASTAAAVPKDSGRANLLAQIQAGAKLKKVDAPPEKSPAGLGKVANNGSVNPRDNVMSAIKQGATLKHVDPAEVAEARKSFVATQEMPGIAGALARALENRRNKIVISDSENEADDDSDWEDE